MNIEKISMPMDAGRVCDAIARIGYSPASALMDVIDNSVTANARNIRIHIVTDADKTYSERSNVVLYRVIDDGEGMGDSGILNALKLGSNAAYNSKSLSKYGMGLKSAGFSLGSKIEVVSKRDGVFTSVYYVDRREINAEYVITRRDINEGDEQLFDSMLKGANSGTIVTVSGCNEVVHQSAATTIGRLQEELGVVYHDFLKREERPLRITIECTNKPEIQVAAFDILFRSVAVNGFDPDTYDCKKPCLFLSKKLAILDDESKNPLLEVVLFPKNDLKDYAGFTSEERDAIRSYKVSRPNKGFFIYRNDRLIRWGDDLDGLIGKDYLLFRARLAITTDHDDQLHVDVSKQRLMIPEDIRDKIKLMIQSALTTSKTIATLCSQLPDVPEGQEFNSRNETLAPEDPEEPVGEDKKSETRARRRKLVEQSSQGDEDEEQPSSVGTAITIEPIIAIPTFRKVRYSGRVSSVNIWESHESPSDGVFVRVNTNHSFYPTVIGQLNEAGPHRQAIEAILWSLAAAENKTLTNLVEIDQDTITKVINRFKKIFGNTLDTWCSSNQDLFVDD